LNSCFLRRIKITVPVRTDDGCCNPELAGERPPRFGEELLGLATWSASVLVIIDAVLGPNGVAVAVRRRS
jgi:hypothetical protein